MTWKCDNVKISEEQMKEPTGRSCESCHPGHDRSKGKGLSLKYRGFLLPGVVGLLIVLGATGLVREVFGLDLVLLAALVGGVPIVFGAVKGLLRKDMNVGVLISIALIASLFIEEYIAGAIVVFIMHVGELLENITVAKTGNAIRALLDLKPKTARVRRADGEMVLPIEEVQLGDRVLVKPCERIPVDGVVAFGQGAVNQAPLTGESIPVEVGVGDEVFEGTLNELGVLEIETTKIGQETTLAHIIKLVEEAQADKAPTQRVADRFAKYFTPLILGIALITYFATGDVIKAITVLIVACPCALVLATPTAVIAAIGNAARRGILIKGGRSLEAAGRVNAVVVDKTGTLTYGNPQVTEIRSFSKKTQRDVLIRAAIAEKFSEHPLAKAIINKAQELGLKVPDPSDFQVILGRGVVAYASEQTVILGNRKLLADQQIALPQQAEEYLLAKEANGETCLLLAENDRFLGVISVADVLREGTHQAITALKESGVKRMVMLTGDNPRTAEAIASLAGISDFAADQLPEDKVNTVKRLKQQYKVAVIGDGINDAPALATADVGIAMGVIGSDAAIEAADIALLGDDLAQAAQAILLGRRALRTIKMNIYLFSLGLNAVGMYLAIAGMVGPVMAAVLHNIASVGVVLNSSRLIRYKSSRSQRQS
ncbi:MAG: putative manganese/zinc-exporting P-type ATPase [Dehalococcoidia bacterium]|nr:putative manganese/zinc-exporting P-type ATPase [Chloroflexota bacterium]